jgi:hypothetical protein
MRESCKTPKLQPQETTWGRKASRLRKRHPNYRLVKSHRNYAVEEIARLLDVHKNTVRVWVKAGLQTIDDKRPMLILGQELIAFLQQRRARKRHPCEPGQMYCFRCRLPKFPGGGMVEYRPTTKTVGNLTAICPDCNCLMHRLVNMTKIADFCREIDVTFPQAPLHIREIIQPSANSDLRGDARS